MLRRNINNYTVVRAEDKHSHPKRSTAKRHDITKIIHGCLQYAMSNPNWEDKRYLIGGRRINKLRFADDIVLISNSTIEMEEMVNELNVGGLKIGLEMNMSKTQVMVNHVASNVATETWPEDKIIARNMQTIHRGLERSFLKILDINNGDKAHEVQN
ncbi:hypothetical protein TELCIR_19139 [Teladorsagia circumcincta]|uniref:Reverse transcriptase domain-containing protein n=1 Tax=Teladorsagia circumcincta TaxID=45464 RepID=A0A2G9TQ27_TELCI|nr:hypothetical protein TELCIR_19139 [Teladorsagia circumcincta]